jgi:hypothetical protein
MEAGEAVDTPAPAALRLLERHDLSAASLCRRTHEMAVLATSCVPQVSRNPMNRPATGLFLTMSFFILE